MKKITYIITSLDCGGAENMLYKLIKHSDRSQYYSEVISLKTIGDIGKKLKKDGVKVYALNLNVKNMFKALYKAWNLCKKADVVTTHLYHANLFGFVVAKSLLRKTLIWNIRHVNLDRNANKATTLQIVKICAKVSRFVDCITYDSDKSRDVHIEVGYSNKNNVVIANGFDLNRFKYSSDARIQMRKILNISSDRTVIATVGRWNPQKDYITLFKALSKLKKTKLDFSMIMCGKLLDENNKEIKILVSRYRLEGNLILLGIRDDIPAVLSAADIYVSSSAGESFSNAIAEAMLCELPCIVTDVGASKAMIGDTGKAVQAGDYRAMSNAILEFAKDTSLREIGKLARKRIVENYEIGKITRETEEVYERTLTLRNH